MKPLIPLLLLLAVLVLTGAAAAEEENLIHPPESGVIVTGFTEIDSVQPDTAAAEAFMQSPVYNTVTDCLMQKDTPETLPEEILNLTLEDFPYRTADGEEMICSITVAELLNGMNTTFTGHGWGSSYQTHEYIEISVRTALTTPFLSDLLTSKSPPEKTIPHRSPPQPPSRLPRSSSAFPAYPPP